MTNKRELVESLQGFRLGLARGVVGLQPYAPEWKDAFGFLQRLLVSEGGCECFEIDPVGSTAVPGLIAKPILDVLSVFDQVPDFDPAIAPLERLGFLYKGAYGIEGRHFFTYYDEAAAFDYVHLHAFRRGHGTKRSCFGFEMLSARAPRSATSTRG
jgi:GrpB-like predicted nucleotidyltransferase (UPF0157 family)